MLSCETAEDGQKILAGLSQDERERMELLVLHNRNPFKIAETGQAYELLLSNVCVQAVYTRGVPLPVRKDLVIRKLDLSYTDAIAAHYTLIPESEFIRERIQAGVMYGAFVKNSASTDENELTLAGFIGEHEEGSMGMLEVFPEFRRQGIAEALEAFCINRMLREGRIPFCQIIHGNEASVKLQEKLGLRISKENVWWMHQKI